MTVASSAPPTKSQESALRATLESTVGQGNQVRNFQVTSTLVNRRALTAADPSPQQQQQRSTHVRTAGGASRRLADYSWQISFDVVAPLSSTSYATPDAYATSITEAVSSNAFESEVQNNVGVTLDTATVAAVVHTRNPSQSPTPLPVPSPSRIPTPLPTPQPTPQPTLVPTPQPTLVPTSQPTLVPNPQPTVLPTPLPMPLPTLLPTSLPVPEAVPAVSAAAAPLATGDGGDSSDVSSAGGGGGASAASATGLIIGVVLGAAVLLGLAVGGKRYLDRRGKRKSEESVLADTGVLDGGLDVAIESSSSFSGDVELFSRVPVEVGFDTPGEKSYGDGEGLAKRMLSIDLEGGEGGGGDSGVDGLREEEEKELDASGAGEDAELSNKPRTQAHAVVAPPLPMDSARSPASSALASSHAAAPAQHKPKLEHVARPAARFQEEGVVEEEDRATPDPATTVTASLSCISGGSADSSPTPLVPAGKEEEETTWVGGGDSDEEDSEENDADDDAIKFLVAETPEGEADLFEMLTHGDDTPTRSPSLLNDATTPDQPVLAAMPDARPDATPPPPVAPISAPAAPFAPLLSAPLGPPAPAEAPSTPPVESASVAGSEVATDPFGVFSASPVPVEAAVTVGSADGAGFGLENSRAQPPPTPLSPNPASGGALVPPHPPVPEQAPSQIPPKTASQAHEAKL